MQAMAQENRRSFPPRLVTFIGTCIERPQILRLGGAPAARYRLQDTERVVIVTAYGDHIPGSMELRRGDEVEVTGLFSTTTNDNGEHTYSMTAHDVVALPKSLAFDLGLGLI